MALSFGGFGNAFDGSGAGLSLGTSVLKPTSPGMAQAMAQSAPRKTTYSPGRAQAQNQYVPKKATMPPLRTSPLTFGGTLPKWNSDGFKPTFSSLLNNFSLGVPVTSSPSRSSAGIGSVPQIDTITIDGAADAADAAKNLASSIFGDMLQPAAYGDGMGDGAGGTSGGLLDRLGPAELAIGVLGLGLVFMLVSGGGSKRRGR